MLLLLPALFSLSAAIRVEWNTNTGPIIPPTTTVHPPTYSPPYREPAPVWENQDDDVVNPNIYRYVLPPPSRPSFNINDYSWTPASSPDEYKRKYKKYSSYGYIMPKYSSASPLPRRKDTVKDLQKSNSNNNNNNIHNTNTVQALSVYYVPNIGLKYSAIKPMSEVVYKDHHHHHKENNVHKDSKIFKAKQNENFNSEFKKYKAYMLRPLNF